MKQFTVKRAVEAWHWIQNNAHNEVGKEFHPVTGKQTHTYFLNFHEKMRIPEALRVEVFKGIRPNNRAFDTRMYALTRKAREAVSDD